jgi:ribosome maturation factor RimP|tara:strand:+ start:2477 stop:2737 length:261 start_codon:yes stop_codon:yes gene_type:complete
MKINQIISKIGMMSPKELNEVVYAVKFRRENLSKMLRRTFKVGDKVLINSKREIFNGIIKEINIKKAIVEFNGREYRVPFSMMEAA